MTQKTSKATKTTPKVKVLIKDAPAVVDATKEPRRFTPASYRSRHKRRKAERYQARNKVPAAFVIFIRSLRMLRNHWEIFGGILLIYLLLNFLLVGGFSGGTDLQSTKDSLSDLFTGQFSKVSTGFTLFAFLVTSGTGVASGVASAYQTILLVLVSLAIVWALRHLYAGSKIRIRDTFYNSTYPLVQVIFTLFILAIQLLPAALGAFLFSSLVANGIIIVLWQQIIVGVVSFLLLVWTFYMLSASIFALYIVTLPDMTPRKALQSAKDIVRYRRGMVLRKLLFLPMILLIIAAIIMIPLSASFTAVATGVFFVMTAVTVPVVHSYIYALYRELIAVTIR